MMDASSVLVTGSSGTIGTALVERLLAEGVDVTGVDRGPNPWSQTIDDLTVQLDLLDPEAASALPADVDQIVHLAAHSRVQELLEDPALAGENVQTTLAVLEHARQCDADFVFASSREVYGIQGGAVHGEEGVGIQDALNPYGASKVGSESLVSAYARCFNVGTAVLRLSNVYGRFDLSNRVVPLFVARAHRGENLTVYGEHKLLDFLYIDDCVDAIVSALDGFGTVCGEVVNVGSGRGRTILELAELVAERVDEEVTVTIETNRSGEVGRFVADIDRAAALLGYAPEYPLPRGLNETVGWYLDHPEHLAEIG